LFVFFASAGLLDFGWPGSCIVVLVGGLASFGRKIGLLGGFYEGGVEIVENFAGVGVAVASAIA